MVRSFARRAAARLLIVGILFLASFGVFTATTQALPSNEVEFVYYAEPSKQTDVGGRLLACDGRTYTWGQRTAYYDRYETPCY